MPMWSLRISATIGFEVSIAVLALTPSPAFPQSLPPEANSEQIVIQQTKGLHLVHRRRPGEFDDAESAFALQRPLRPPHPQESLIASSESLRVLGFSTFNSIAGPAQEQPHAIATDDSGNTYITGMGTLVPNGCSYLTIKIDPAGRTRWVARYNTETPMTSHSATGIVVDNNGNVMVTGTSEGASGTDDIATVTYDQNGMQLWAARYDGISGGDDTAVGIALDSAGFIYVAGSTIGRNESADVIVLKYHPDGAQVWSAHYDGSDHLDDLAQAMATTPSGDIVVIAQSDNARGDSDYLTICFDSTGALRWAARHDRGPGYDEHVSAVAANGRGNVYVTGWGQNKNSGTSSETVTISYSPSGSQRWLARYCAPNNGRMWPYAIAVDSREDVIVTGQHEGSGHPNLGTIAYDSLGNQRWIDLYDGPAMDYDAGRDVTISEDGSVYVAGESRGTGGNWAAQDDFVTIQFTRDGVRQWVRRYNGPAGGYDQGVHCILDRAMNLTVAGRSERATNENDIAVVRYDRLGTEQWVTRYNGDGSSHALPTAVSTDANGNIYLLGLSSRSGSWYDMALCKFDRDGVLHWSKTFELTPGGYDGFSFLAVDHEGSVVVCGECDAPNSLYRDIVTIKFDSTGNQLWVRTYNSPANSWDSPTGMQVDYQGNIIVVGRTASNSIIVIKYDRSGNELWKYGSTISGSPVLGPVVDKIGNTYSLLSQDGSQGGVLLLMHSARGELCWTADWRVPQSSMLPMDIAVDRFGFVFLLSKLSSSGSPDVITVTKFSPLGRLLWTATEEPPTGAQWGFSHRLLVDEAGRCVAAGSSWSYPPATTRLEMLALDDKGQKRWSSSGSIGEGGVFTIQHLRGLSNGGYEVTATIDGRELAVVQYADDGHRLGIHSLPLSVFTPSIQMTAINPFGEMVLAGTRWGPWWSTAVVLRVGGFSVAGEVVPPFMAGTVRLEQNFPNPFNHSTLIHFALSMAARTTVSVHNSLGQTVSRLIDDDLPSGEHNIVWDARGMASGVYVVVVKAGAGQAAKKAMLLR